jgi:hypothetical protein
MDPPTIVETFNPLGNLGSGDDVVRKLLSVNKFSLETTKKASSDCILPAISFFVPPGFGQMMDDYTKRSNNH